MKPFFFGAAEAQLYGVMHAPIAASRRAAVLLCYPFGQEYMRAHRAYRQLALLLSKKGFHVMRFDYRGTGDSSGALEETTLENWLEDTVVAAEELKAMSGLSSVSLVGLRLGALVAAMASKRIEGIDRLALWDPVVSGSSYDQELLQEITERLGSLSSFVDAKDNLHFNGFALHARFRQQMREVDLHRESPKALKTLEIVSNEESPNPLKNTWEGQLSGFEYLHTPAPGDWNYVDNFGGILLPQPVIQGIVNWFE